MGSEMCIRDRYTYPTVGTTLFRKTLFVAVLVETRACRPRDACYPGCARHLSPLYVPVSPCAPSATCKLCPMALNPDSIVDCPRPPGRNLDLSSSGHAQGPCVGFIYIQLPKLSSTEIQLFTHHDIAKQYRKGLTAIVDRCVYVSYNRHHAVPKSFICCCSGRDSCMLTSRCMLPWLRSAPYPALCPCEPLRPASDMQALSYGARSRQYSRLPPSSRS